MYQYLTQVLGVKEVLLMDDAKLETVNSNTQQASEILPSEKSIVGPLCLAGEGLVMPKIEFWIVGPSAELTLEQQELTLKMVSATQADPNGTKVLWCAGEEFSQQIANFSQAPFVVILSDLVLADLQMHTVMDRHHQKIMWTHGPQSVGTQQDRKKSAWNDLKKIMTYWSK